MQSTEQMLLSDMMHDRHALYMLLQQDTHAAVPHASCPAHALLSWGTHRWLQNLSLAAESGSVDSQYENALSFAAPEKLAFFLRPTATGHTSWSPAFTPLKFARPPDSTDPDERRALFIASHEQTHYLYQWRPADGWQHIPVQGEDMFFTYGGLLRDAKRIENYLEGIPLAEHVVYHASDVEFPFAPQVQAGKIPLDSVCSCALHGQAVSFDLGWSALTIRSPQISDEPHVRRIPRWGLHSMMQRAFPRFQAPCQHVLKMFITGQAREPDFVNGLLESDTLWEHLAPQMEDMLAVVRHLSCPVFLDGWFNSRLLKNAIFSDLPPTACMGATNFFTPWHRVLCPSACENVPPLARPHEM